MSTDLIYPSGSNITKIVQSVIAKKYLSIYLNKTMNYEFTNETET